MKKQIQQFCVRTKENPSLKRILFIIALHAIAPAIFIIIYLYLGQRQTNIQEFEESLTQIANYTANTYNQEFLRTKYMLSFLSELPSIKTQNQAECETFVRSLLTQDQDSIYAGIGALDKDGNVYCSTKKLDAPVNLSDRKYFQDVQMNKRFVVAGFTIGKATSNQQITTAFPVLDDQGGFNGLVSAGIDVKWLDRLVKNVKLPDDYTVTAMDQNGIVVGRSPDFEKWIGQDVKATPFGKALFSQDETEGVFTSVGLNGEERVHAFASTQDSIGDGKVRIVIGVPKEESIRVANQNLGRDILVLLGIIFSAVFVCAFDLHFILKTKVVEVE